MTTTTTTTTSSTSIPNCSEASSGSTLNNSVLLRQEHIEDVEVSATTDGGGNDDSWAESFGPKNHRVLLASDSFNNEVPLGVNSIFAPSHKLNALYRSNPGGVRRRLAAARPVCQTGMDRVGSHIETIRSWIDHVHKESVQTSSSRSRLFPSRPDKRGVPVTDKTFPRDVSIQADFANAIRGLNECVQAAYQNQCEEEEEEEEEESDSDKNNKHAGDVRRIVESVARIPSLMKTILLIENDEDRTWVMSNPILKRVMLCRYSIISQNDAFETKLCKEASSSSSDVSDYVSRETGNTDQDFFSALEKRSWITSMLRKKDTRLNELAVHYLETISDLSVEDYLSVRFLGDGNEKGPKPTEEDMIQFQKERKSLFSAVSSLRLLFMSIYQHDDIIERVSVTAVVQYALDATLCLPFSIGYIFMDMLCRFLLLLSARSIILEYFNDRIIDGETIIHFNGTLQDRIMEQLASVSVLLLLYKIYLEAYGMFSVSWSLFFRHMRRFWTFLHVTYVVIALARTITLSECFIWWCGEPPSQISDGLSIFYALTLGLGWFDFNGVLRVLNLRFATLVLALIQIVKDIMLFLLLLLILILAFGEMLFGIISINESVCVTEDPEADPVENPFCDDVWISYLSVYKLIVGDVSVDDYLGSPLTVVLFVALTFFGILIMLTILISIVDESYEKAKFKANRLFGRTRLTLAATISASQIKIFPILTMRKYGRTFSQRALIYMSQLSAKYIPIGSVFMALAKITNEIFKELRRNMPYGSALAIVVILTLPFFVTCAILTSYLITGWGEGRLVKWKWIRKFQENSFYRYCVVRPVTFFCFSILGIGSGGRTKQEWKGRLEHIDESLEERAAESDKQMKEALAAMEERMEEMETRRMEDTNKMHQRMDEFRKSMKKNEEKMMLYEEKRLAELEELKNQITSMEANIVESLLRAVSS